MYKTALTIQLLLLVAFAADAKKVSAEKAVEAASQLCRELDNISIRSGSGKQQVTLVYAAKPDSEKTVPETAEQDACFYVFNIEGDGGFVVISGDDRARPVLGYSMQGRFETDKPLPYHIAGWLEHYRDEIAAMTADGDPSLPPHPEWQRMTGGMPPVKLRSSTILYTASWDQSYPYNLQCPSMDGKQAVTGCVATAMATVMKYHADRGYRARGTGNHMYVDDGMTHSVSFGAFDWANMQDRTEDFTSDIQREAVARLMYHCGVSIESDYDPDGTGSYDWRTSVALTSFFGFDGRLVFIEKERYGDSEWKRLIRQEIDAERPVIYDGFPKSGSGHSFVLSGYNDDDMFFFNWGWSGRYNGWFALSALNPAMNEFSYKQGMIAGIQPPVGEQPSRLRFVKGNNTQLNPDGMVTTENGNNMFLIHGGAFENRSYEPFYGSIGVALVNAGGVVREIAGSIDGCVMEGNHYMSSTHFIGDLYCTVTLSRAPGDMLRFVSTEDGRQTWQTICGAPGITVETPVANETDALYGNVRVYAASGGAIVVNTPAEDRIRIHSLSGALLLDCRKQAGEQHFDLRLPHGSAAVVSGQGWTRKIFIFK